MKKLFNMTLCLALIIPLLVVPIDLNAKTLRNLKTELATMIADLNKTNTDKQLTQAQINAIYKEIDQTNSEINEIQVQLGKLNNEIVVLNDNIESKDKEIKEIVNFVQVENGESAYLEYAFGAKSFTDFIYRMAVSEQLAKYNQELITDYNDMIVKNNNKIVDLHDTTESLINKQDQLDVTMKKLGSKMSEFTDLKVSIEEEIKTQQEAIALYESMGCNLDEDIKICGREKLPNGTALFRPLEKGYVTSEFGNRCYNLNGRWTCDFHSGLDISVRPNTNVEVYAAGVGTVIALVNKSSCGGNKVYIHHKINNQYYTTAYVHLRKILVSPGDVVTKSTVVGIMGGDPGIETWDKCSTGAHVHFQIATGLYLKDYSSYTTFINRTVNPRNIINVPAGMYNWFYDRVSKY